MGKTIQALSIAIIFLFFGSSFSTIIYANNTIMYNENDNAEIIIRIYNNNDVTYSTKKILKEDSVSFPGDKSLR